MKGNNIPLAEGSNKPDNEDLFLNDCLGNYSYWKGEAARLSAEGKKFDLEADYAEAYKVMINRFTAIDK